MNIMTCSSPSRSCYLLPSISSLFLSLSLSLPLSVLFSLRHSRRSLDAPQDHRRDEDPSSSDLRINSRVSEFVSLRASDDNSTVRAIRSRDEVDVEMRAEASALSSKSGPAEDGCDERDEWQCAHYATVIRGSLSIRGRLRATEAHSQQGAAVRRLSLSAA